MTTNPLNSILINESDDVATTLLDLAPGDVGRYMSQGWAQEIVIAQTIPKYHKFALRDIRRSEPIRKYGEVIGMATQDIEKGAHVHTHNLVSPERESI